MKNSTFLIGATACLLWAGASQAATVFAGEPTATDAATARASWEDSVAAFTTDALDGLSGVLGTDTELTSDLGNKFRDGRGLINPNTLDSGVFTGLSLRLDKGFAGSHPGELTWELESPSFALGFDIASQNNGTLGIVLQFIDNTTQSFSFADVGTSISNSQDRSFWGISGLTNAVSHVHLSVPDYGGISYYDNFSYSSIAPVPLPAGLPLMGGGLALLWAMKRRKTQAGA